LDSKASGYNNQYRVQCQFISVLGAFAQLRKSLLASSCLSIRLQGTNKAPTGGMFMQFDIRVFFENLSKNFKFHLILTRTAGI
jgi:hypothetical protein